MDFDLSPHAPDLCPPPFLEDLKTLAREQGLWNLFLPGLRAAGFIAQLKREYARARARLAL